VPTYDYECSACSKRLEAFHGMSDPPLKKCPKCGKRRLRRLIGAGAGVIFKGSGFYTTDYRSSSYASAKKSDSEAPAPAKSDSGACAKPACATDGGQSSPATPAPAAAPAKTPAKKK
jgi:putative FmdB family regulatory protein